MGQDRYTELKTLPDDREQLSPMTIAAKDVLHREELHAIADKGYFSGP